MLTMLRVNIKRSQYYLGIIVMMLFASLFMSCKSQKTITEDFPSQTITCEKCQGSGQERFCPKCASSGLVVPNPQGGPDWAVGICPVCHGSGRAFVRPCRTCNGIGEITIANLQKE